MIWTMSKARIFWGASILRRKRSPYDGEHHVRIAFDSMSAPSRDKTGHRPHDHQVNFVQYDPTVDLEAIPWLSVLCPTNRTDGIAQQAIRSIPCILLLPVGLAVLVLTLISSLV